MIEHNVIEHADTGRDVVFKKDEIETNLMISLRATPQPRDVDPRAACPRATRAVLPAHPRRTIPV